MLSALFVWSASAWNPAWHSAYGMDEHTKAEMNKQLYGIPVLRRGSERLWVGEDTWLIGKGFWSVTSLVCDHSVPAHKIGPGLD